MNKLLNILTVIIGIGLAISGLAKLSGNFDQLTFVSGQMYLTVPNYTWPLLVLIFDLGGGVSMIIHGIITYNFRSETHPDLLDMNEGLKEHKLPRLAVITGNLILVSCGFILIWLFFLLSGLFSMGVMNGVLFFVATLVSIIVFPSILVIKNYGLNNKIAQKIKSKKMEEFHEKRKGRGYKRSR